MSVVLILFFPLIINTVTPSAQLFVWWWGRTRPFWRGRGSFFVEGNGERGAATYSQHADRVDRELVNVGVTHVCGVLDWFKRAKGSVWLEAEALGGCEGEREEEGGRVEEGGVFSFI